MEIINLKELEQGSIVEGFVWLREVSEKPNKNGGSRVVALASYMGKDIDVVAFNDEQKTSLMKENINEGVVYIEATVDSYNKNKQLVVKNVFEKKEVPKIAIFMKSLDVGLLKEDFKLFLEKNIDENVRKVISNIFQKEVLFERFFEEFAGMKNHDAQIGGLLNHELKMLKLAKTLVENDSRLECYKQELYFGIVFHDIGKIYELKRGEYTKLSAYVNHIYFGLEILIENKNMIIDELGEKFFYDVISIVQGHHGKWGERPKTVIAQIAHFIDMLDSQVTGFMDTIENEKYRESDNGNKTIATNQYDEYLNLMI